MSLIAATVMGLIAAVLIGGPARAVTRPECPANMMYVSPMPDVKWTVPSFTLDGAQVQGLQLNGRVGICMPIIWEFPGPWPTQQDCDVRKQQARRITVRLQDPTLTQSKRLQLKIKRTVRRMQYRACNAYVASEAITSMVLMGVSASPVPLPNGTTYVPGTTDVTPGPVTFTAPGAPVMTVTFTCAGRCTDPYDVRARFSFS